MGAEEKNREEARLSFLRPHFSVQELACRCCGRLWIVPGLLDALEELRAVVGAPIIVLSGFRCPAHNSRVGGSSKSRHLTGQAADLTIPGLTPAKMLALALGVAAFARGGAGLYPREGFIHVDLRPVPARWARLGSRYTSLAAAGLETSLLPA